MNHIAHKFSIISLLVATVGFVAICCTWQLLNHKWCVEKGFYALRPVAYLERIEKNKIGELIATAERVIAQGKQMLTSPNLDATGYLGGLIRGYVNELVHSLEFRTAQLQGAEGIAIDYMERYISEAESTINGIGSFLVAPIDTTAAPQDQVLNIIRNLKSANRGALPDIQYNPKQRQVLQEMPEQLVKYGIDFNGDLVLLVDENSWLGDLFGFKGGTLGVFIPINIGRHSHYIMAVQSQSDMQRFKHTIVHERVHGRFKPRGQVYSADSIWFSILNEAVTETLAIEVSDMIPEVAMYPRERLMLRTICKACQDKADFMKLAIDYLTTGKPNELKLLFGEAIWDKLLELTNTWKPYSDGSAPPTFVDARIPSYLLFLRIAGTALAALANGENQDLVLQKLEAGERLLELVDEQQKVLILGNGWQKLYEAMLTRHSADYMAYADSDLLYKGAIDLCDALMNSKDSGQLQLAAEDVNAIKYTAAVYAEITKISGINLAAPQDLRFGFPKGATQAEANI